MESSNQEHETRVVTPGHANFSGFALPTLIFEEILLQLPIDDVHHCMSVCKTWYEILHQNGFFWKAYIQKHYDLTPVDNIRKSGLDGSMLGSWESEDHCFHNYSLTEHYVFKPFPKLLKCDIIIGAEYNPMEGMVSGDEDKLGTSTGGSSKSKKIDYHNLAISISILRHILKRSKEFQCNSPAHGNEGYGFVMVWLAPYQEKSQKPLGMDWVMSYFNANTEMYKEEYGHFEQKLDELLANRMSGSFGMPNLIGLPHGDRRRPMQGYQEEDYKGDSDTKERQKSFQKWLQRLYRPSYNFYCGEGIMNEVVYFHYTTLAPGYVGGIMSNISMT